MNNREQKEIRELKKILNQAIKSDSTRVVQYLEEESYRKFITQQYNRLIKEDLSVSTHVEKVANYLFNAIKQNQNIKQIKNIDFIGYAKLTLKAYNFDDIIDVNNFADESKYIRKPTTYINKSQQIHDIEFYLEYATLNGEIVNGNLSDSIYHEVEHAYQDYSIISKKIDITNNPQNKLYDFAINNIKHPNDYIFAICVILYMSNWGEQDAFANQLYSSLLQCKAIDKNNMYLHYFESGTYKTLKQLLKLQKQIPKWNENSDLYIEMKNILKNNNINFNKNQILKLLDNTIKRFRIKIDKVISKFMKERNITERIAWSSSTGIIREIIKRTDEIEKKII
jgi:hypothetical protein